MAETRPAVFSSCVDVVIAGCHARPRPYHELERREPIAARGSTIMNTTVLKPHGSFGSACAPAPATALASMRSFLVAAARDAWTGMLSVTKAQMLIQQPARARLRRF
jgi:hypothetical protein